MNSDNTQGKGLRNAVGSTIGAMHRWMERDAMTAQKENEYHSRRIAVRVLRGSHAKIPSARGRVRYKTEFVSHEQVSIFGTTPPPETGHDSFSLSLSSLPFWTVETTQDHHNTFNNISKCLSSESTKVRGSPAGVAECG